MWICYICLLWGVRVEIQSRKHNGTIKKSALLPSPLCTGLYLMYIQSCPVTLQPPPLVRTWFLCSGLLGKAELPWVKAVRLRQLTERELRVRRENKPDGGLLSHSNRAKILINLCILTFIAEHFFVFERKFIPVCMRDLCVHRCVFSHLFSALILDLQ